jgi:hypothetical protein
LTMQARLLYWGGNANNCGKAAYKPVGTGADTASNGALSLRAGTP